MSGDSLLNLADQVAEAGRLLVASDFDGVLAPIVDNPEAVSPLAPSMEALQLLSTLSDTSVAVVSGRNYALLATLVVPHDGITLVGSHGAELGPGTLDDDEQLKFDRLVDHLGVLAGQFPGFFVEVKTVSAAAHFRRMVEGQAEAAAAVAELAEQWPAKIVSGKEVVEFTLRHSTKGDAIAELRGQHEVDRVVYLGDDVTDEDVFAILGPQDVGIKVGPGETLARYRLEGPDEVSRWLTRLAVNRQRLTDSG